MSRRILRYVAFVILSYFALTNVAAADTIAFSGVIIQSTDDGTGPAANNFSLNNIRDGDAYVVSVTFAGSITTPGTYDLTGGSLLFSDPSAPATESSFGTVSLTVIQNGGFDDISLFACLTTGSDCSVGNELTANFEIAAASLNAQNVAATGLDQPHPLDLLEDDGITDIHGSITNYSYTAVAPPPAVPEPASMLLLSGGLLAVVARRPSVARRRNPHD